jgi:TP901 family phage tail tape measure protein
VSSFEPIVTDLEFRVPVGQTRADLGEIRRVYSQTTGAMSDDALRLAVAQEKLNRSLARTGAESLSTQKATVAYRNDLRALAVEAQRTAITQERAAAAATAAQLRAAQTVGHALTRYVAAPTALIAFEAVKMRVEFNRQMLMVQTQAGATGAEVKNLTGQVLQLARSVPQSPEELAKGLYHLESLGLRGAKAMGVLKTSSIAAFMGIADLEEVTTALGASVVTGIQGTENYDRAMGTLNATIGAGNMRMDDLVAALGTGVLPAAKNAGLSLDQVGAALAVLTDRGMGADESATRLRMTFALMEAPTGKAKKALKDLGIDANELATLLRQPDGLLKVLQLLHDKMQAAGDTRGSRDIIQALGGGRSSAAILTLIQSLDAQLSSYQQKLGDVRKNTDKFFNDQHDVKNSDAYKLATAWSSVQVDLIKLGATIAPIVVVVAGGLSAIADGFDHLGHTAKTEIEVIIGLLAVGGPLLLATAGVIKSVALIGKTFKLMPVEAAPAIAATEAELAGLGVSATTTAGEVALIGGAATGANGKVALLRGSLLGLGALSIAPIVIPIAIKVEGSEESFIKDHLGRGAAALFSGIENIATGGVAGRNPIHQLGDAIFGSNKKPANTSGMSNDPLHDAAGRGGGSSTTTTKGPPSTTTMPDYKPSRAAQLNLALAKNPNSPAAIKAKLDYDQEAAAFAEKRIASGKGNPQLVQSLQSVYQDEASLRSQLQQIAQQKAQDAAARARAAKAAKAKIDKQRDAHITKLEKVPADLVIEEMNARANGASTERLVSILKQEKKALDEQIAQLHKINASKDAVAKAYTTKASIQKKIDTLTKKKTTSTSAGDFFTEAANEYGLYGSNIAGPNGLLSGQDARAKLAEIALHLSKIASSSASTEKHTGAMKKNRLRDIDLVSDAATHGY